METYSPSSGSYTGSAPSGSNNYYAEGASGDDSTTMSGFYQEVSCSASSAFTFTSLVGHRFSDDGVYLEASFKDSGDSLIGAEPNNTMVFGDQYTEVNGTFIKTALRGAVDYDSGWKFKTAENSYPVYHLIGDKKYIVMKNVGFGSDRWSLFYDDSWDFDDLANDFALSSFTEEIISTSGDDSHDTSLEDFSITTSDNQVDFIATSGNGGKLNIDGSNISTVPSIPTGSGEYIFQLTDDSGVTWKFKSSNQVKYTNALELRGLSDITRNGVSKTITEFYSGVEEFDDISNQSTASHDLDFAVTDSSNYPQISDSEINRYSDFYVMGYNANMKYGDNGNYNERFDKTLSITGYSTPSGTAKVRVEAFFDEESSGTCYAFVDQIKFEV